MVYYIMYKGQVTGPMNSDQIFAYGVDRNTMVSADGGDWHPLYTYPELMEKLSQHNSGNTSAHYTPVGNYQRMVSFGEAIKLGFQNYVNFSGRASRSEFWWWILFTQLLSWVLSFSTSPYYVQILNGMDPTRFYIDYITSPGGIISTIISLALFLPMLALYVRRLHDIGRSGWWILLGLILCIGQIILIVWLCRPSQETENEYGPVPNVDNPYA